MVRTGIEKNRNRIVKIHHPKRAPPGELWDTRETPGLLLTVVKEAEPHVISSWDGSLHKYLSKRRVHSSRSSHRVTGHAGERIHIQIWNPKKAVRDVKPLKAVQ